MAFGAGAAGAAPARSGESVSLDGVSLLLVEDNEINQVVASELLRGAGARVTVASSGSQALEILGRGARIDLVLMDLQMPEMDGFETTIRIRRALGRTAAELPIIALSASALVEERRRAEAAGVNGFVGKPFDPGELFRRIAEQLGRGADATAPAEIDAALLREYTFGDTALARRILTLYLGNAPGYLESLLAAMAAQDWSRAALVAHTFKSASGFIGAAAFAAVLAEVEKAGRNGEPGADPARLKAQAEQVLADVRATLQRE